MRVAHSDLTHLNRPQAEQPGLVKSALYLFLKQDASVSHVIALVPLMKHTKSSAYSSVLKIEELISSETQTNYHNTRRHTPESSSLCSHAMTASNPTDEGLLKSPWYPLDRKLGGTQNRSRHYGVQKKLLTPAGNRTPAITSIVSGYTRLGYPGLLG
jgi:hypothetical protein